MFVYSLKASTLKLAGVTLASILTLCALILLIPPSEDAPTDGYAISASGEKTKTEYGKIKTADDMDAFIKSLGWSVGQNPKEIVDVKIPEKFNNIYLKYNDLQKRQGLDLEQFRGKSAKRYTYEITNYPDRTDTVYLNIIIYKNKIIAGDVCSADAAGFVHGFIPETV